MDRLSSDDFRHEGDLRTRSLSDLILEVTEPPGGAAPLELLLTKPAGHFAVGLLQGCRNYLRAGCALFDASLEGAIAPLARSAMEFSATGTWLVRDPPENVKRFLRAELYEIDQLGRSQPEEAARRRRSLLNAFKWLLPASERTAMKLPSLPDRLGDQAKDLYRQYRMLCEEVHPSFVAAVLAYKIETTEEGDPEQTSVGEDDFIRYVQPERAESGDYLFLTAFWTWLLAADVEVHTGTRFPDALHAAGDALWKSRFDEISFVEMMRRLNEEDD